MAHCVSRRCPHRITLTKAELADLASVPGGVRELEPETLQESHAGPHFALCQGYPGPFGYHGRWLRWDDTARDLLIYWEDETCQAVIPAPGVPEGVAFCYLSADHAGTHRYPPADTRRRELQVPY
jgi:hypothetical protein